MVQQRNTTKNMVQRRNNFHILETFVNFSTLFGESTKEIIIKRNLEFADGNKALYNLQTGKYLKIKKNGLNIDNLYLVEDNVSVIMDQFNIDGYLNYDRDYYLINPKLLPKTFLSWKNYTEPQKRKRKTTKKSKNTEP